MADEDSYSCPVISCPVEGTLSQVIHHISEQDDDAHTWNALGYKHSYDFRQKQRYGGEGSGKLDDQVGDQAGSEKDDAGGATQGPDSEERGQFDESISLEEVPGIGGTRADALREHGYTTPGDVASASIEELQAVPKISEPTARCIRVTAQETCGYPKTFISSLAAQLGVDRTELTDAYYDLAACVVEPDDAVDTLRELVQGDDQSVMQLTDYSVRYRHFLREAGFERIQDVATAEIEELTEASYIGDAMASRIRQTAREKLDNGARSAADSESSMRPEIAEDDDGSAELREDRIDANVDTRERDRTDRGTVTSSSISGEFPAAMRERDQWLLWMPTDDGRKVPRAPWSTGNPRQFVDGMEPANWTSFADAVEWMQKLPHNFQLAYALTREDEFVFIDLDDVVEAGETSPEAMDLVDEAQSYAAVSTSGTGIHIFGRGSLSEDVKSITGPLDEDGEQSIEVYDRNRFVAMTGDHIDDTPTTVQPVTALLDRLEDEYGHVSSSTPDRAITEPRRSREELEDIETTAEIQDVFDAIRQTRPGDIWLRSEQTREHGDGTASYDPSWTHSESGTRVGALEDIWIYRKGMLVLDALQIVALEEGIIQDEREYPEGDAFWEAVEALRDRGAHIPQYRPERATTDLSVAEQSASSIDERELAKRLNYGDPVRTHVEDFDRDYQEQLALKLAPVLAESARSLELPPPVAYRAAQVYAAGHAAGVVPGAAHEATLGAALRIASIEAGEPRPLQDIAATVDESTKTIRNKVQRLITETGISDAIAPSDLVVEPVEYVPYVARKLGVSDEALCASVRDALESAQNDGGSNPVSEVAAAFYAMLKQSPTDETTQREIADAVNLTTMTIRNNYRKYFPENN